MPESEKKRGLPPEAVINYAKTKRDLPPEAVIGYEKPVPPPPVFGIVASEKRNQLGGELTLEGTGFTPDGAVKITLANVPNRPPVFDAPGAMNRPDKNGAFTYYQTFYITSQNKDDAFQDVEVAALDRTTGRVANATISASIWVDMG